MVHPLPQTHKLSNPNSKVYNSTGTEIRKALSSRVLQKFYMSVAGEIVQ